MTEVKNSNHLPTEYKLQEDGKYEILKVLGQGGFGITYLAYFNKLDTKVAIKEFYPKSFCERENTSVIPSNSYQELYNSFRNKFLEEAKQLAQFNHENIVKVTDYFEENNTAYFVMEYIEGVTLYDHISKNLKLSIADTLSYIIQIGHALEVLHDKNILHRDVKPQNAIINKSGKVILIDFGAAREIVDSSMEQTAILSHGYAPPEQYERVGKKGPGLDVYSLGATLYHCLTGQIPIPSYTRYDTPMKEVIELNPGIDEKLNEITMQALEMNLQDRFENVSQLIYELSTIAPADNNQELNLTDSQGEGLRIVEHFLLDPKIDVLIITGMANTGKSTLVHRLRDQVQREKLTLKILTVGSRIAQNLAIRNGLDAKSIYSEIYNLSQFESNEKSIKEEDSDLSEFGRKYFKLQQNLDPLDTIYIIDEAQLLSDNYLENEFVQFGSGKLLKDFISYVKFLENSNRKLIFIGDDKQLLRGTKDESALIAHHLETTYQLNVKYIKLTEVINKHPNLPLLDNLKLIANSIDIELFNQLEVKPDGEQLQHIEGIEFEEIYKNLEFRKDTVCLTYSNSKALQTNQYIRKVLHQKDNLDTGDRIVLLNSISVKQNGVKHNLHNGEFGDVIEVDPEVERFVQPLSGREPTTLIFRKATVSFTRIGSKVDIIFLENFLISDRKQLTNDEYIALNNRARKNFKDKKSNGLLGEMKFKEYVQLDEYFNVALIKYGYSITTHRAQGSSWTNLFINCETDQAKDNIQYFRWLYTGLKSAKDNVYLLNAPHINPFMFIEWKDNEKAFSNFLKIEKNILAQEKTTLNPEEEKLLVKFGLVRKEDFLKWFFITVYDSLSKENIKIDKIDHNSYHETYHFSQESTKVRIIFYYNSKGEFGKTKLLPKSELTNHIIEKIQNLENEIDENGFPQPFLLELFNQLKENLIGSGAFIYSITHKSLLEEYTISTKDLNKVLKLNIYYKNTGFISTIMPIAYNDKELMKDIKSVINKIENVD